MGVKCFLMDVPVYFAADVWLRHCYAYSASGHKTANAVPNAGRDLWRNITRCTALLFGRAVFDERFRRHCLYRHQ